MKILLPNEDMVIEEGVAEIKNGNLYLYKNGVFRSVMYELAYKMFGSNECYYCHRKLKTNPSQTDSKKYFLRMSMEHLYAQDEGGPTITNNLRPACTDCNSQKGNMSEAEYREYRKLLQRTAGMGKEGRAERKLFKKNIMLTHELRRYGNMDSLPQEWISDIEIKDILMSLWITSDLGKSYELLAEQAQKYNYISKVAVLSRNYYLLDGANAVLVSKFYKLPVRVIYLENVIFNGFPYEE